MSKVNQILARVDWKLLREQKLALINLLLTPGADPMLEGLLPFLDTLQEAAEADGFPVVWLSSEEPDDAV